MQSARIHSDLKGLGYIRVFEAQTTMNFLPFVGAQSFHILFMMITLAIFLALSTVANAGAINDSPIRDVSPLF